MHCMIHRQALAAKTLPTELKEVLDDTVKMVNFVVVVVGVPQVPLQETCITQISDRVHRVTPELLCAVNVVCLSVCCPCCTFFHDVCGCLGRSMAVGAAIVYCGVIIVYSKFICSK